MLLWTSEHPALLLDQGTAMVSPGRLQEQRGMVPDVLALCSVPAQGCFLWALNSISSNFTGQHGDATSSYLTWVISSYTLTHTSLLVCPTGLN